MKKQIVIIGGGTSFNDYQDYISFLKNSEVVRERLYYGTDWKSTISEDLGSIYEVFMPKMPNTTNAQYAEWLIWFNRLIPFLEDDVILIGHSLGGIFLAKYLSEDSELDKKIKAIILIAPPYDRPFIVEDLGSFMHKGLIANLSSLTDKIFIFQSQDDQVVPYENAKQYKMALPDIELKLFTDRGHFKQLNFPELVDLIKSLG